MGCAFASGIGVSCRLWALLAVRCLEDSGPEEERLVKISDAAA